MKLIVFFNGWGMDKSILPKENVQLEEKEMNLGREIVEENWEIIYVNYPYEFPFEKLRDIEELVFIGWSFGVYYCNKFLGKNPEFQKYLSIAINGTPEMIGEYGISEKIMSYTLENLSEESLKKFYLNMGCTPEYLENSAKKNVDSLGKELEYFMKNYTVEKNFMKRAIISQKDRIVSSKNQKRYYDSKRVQIEEIYGGHFVFGENRTLNGIREMVEDEI